MSIVASELVWRRSAEVSDAGTNGGRMDDVSSPSNVKNNIFPDVPASERTAGSTKYRKMFIHVANDADLALVDPKVFVETRTPGDDAVYFFAGTQRDLQSAITGSEDLYGGAVLNTALSGSETTISVAVEDATKTIFRDGDTIRLSDKASVDAGTGNEEYLVIDTGGVGIPSGNVIALTVTTPVQNAYSTSDTKIASVYLPADVQASYDTFTVSTVGDGAYNDTTNPVVMDHIGTVEQDWTLTFTSATAFDCTGDELGAVGSGTTGGDFSPNNPDFTKPYFTLEAAGFSGTYQSGDTITFTTHPAALPIWYRREVPAGASSLSGNSVIVAVDGESA